MEDRMCGIAGQVRCDGRPVDVRLLDDMCAALEHRGPDSRGSHHADGVGLGIQRLRIIDLETGDQPIYNEDRSIVVVLNGEIYNFRELRSQLERAGHSFSTASDTEVIVHAYEQNGPACVRDLQGMFAFALWDSRRQQLLLARDRVGKKPLYYARREGAITFASELNSLMLDDEIPREIDPRAIDCYLAYQYVAAPMCVFSAVRKLAPATTLLYRDGRVELERYWRLDYSRKRLVTSAAELQEELREIVRRSVRRRMVADVPVGAFLSGGVDSSGVVAAMAEASAMPVKTFSIGFQSAAFNELPYARRIAEQFGTDHHEFVVEPDALAMVPRIARQYGEPFADASAIPSFYVAELTRQHVTVALNGDGGDESFGGYNRYVANAAAQWLDRLPKSIRQSLAALGERVPASHNTRSTRDRLRRLARSLALKPPARYARTMSYFDWVQRDQLYTPDYREQVGESLTQQVISEPWAAATGSSVLDVMLEVDVGTYLPGDLLVKIDIATMAHSLEARSPLLDQEVMEFAASLPAELKMRGTSKKVILRDALRAWLPDDVLDRPKQGFGVPIDEWFRADLRDHVEEVLFDPVTLARGYFRPQYVRELVDRHVACREDTSPRLWALLMLELWHREVVDGHVGGRRQAAA
jgi:asparagine synthase (glutamine-hydrolysing)